MSDIANKQDVYRALVIDSGPIIRLSGLSSLRDKATQYVTVPAVLAEIRDAKARAHLEQLPFELVPRAPSQDALVAMTEFSKKTGDYHSLSSVDLQVLALVYDLEREGCSGNMDHIRTTPKRTIGLGNIELLSGQKKADGDIIADEEEKVAEDEEDLLSEDEEDQLSEEHNSLIPSEIPSKDNTVRKTADNDNESKPKTWAMLVNPSAASPIETTLDNLTLEQNTAHNILSSNVEVARNASNEPNDESGQFSDAEEDDDIPIEFGTQGPQEEANDSAVSRSSGVQSKTLEEELNSDFPSLAASLHVPYEGSDDEGDLQNSTPIDKRHESKSNNARQPARPVKTHNPLGNYAKLLKATAQKQSSAPSKVVEPGVKPIVSAEEPAEERKEGSRIMGGMTMAGQGFDVDDDGEGWITSTKDIQHMKASGTIDPLRNPRSQNAASIAQKGPPLSDRAACTTTDFAMQNVILQMGLELLSVDGVKIRRLKSWVTRCGACYKVYSSTDTSGPVDGIKRMFCDRCGSDMLQRIAASVDGKTGRLKLHFSKKHKNNLRGTKFSLPKPGTGNRFKGDLLLREDQLLSGAWNQRAKIQSGGKAKKATESMFGQDIATNVGCHATFGGDIRVGLGRRNPNSAKGRERRGKKKKSSDKACGVRRY